MKKHQFLFNYQFRTSENFAFARLRSTYLEAEGRNQQFLLASFRETDDRDEEAEGRRGLYTGGSRG